jgi:hypothetical protein
MPCAAVGLHGFPRHCKRDSQCAFSHFVPFWGLGCIPKFDTSLYRLFGSQRNGMRITHSEGEHLVVLSDAEAAALVEASALLVIASKSIVGASLPPGMAKVLGQLFDGLKASTAAPAAADHGN